MSIIGNTISTSIGLYKVLLAFLVYTVTIMPKKNYESFVKKYLSSEYF